MSTKLFKIIAFLACLATIGMFATTSVFSTANQTPLIKEIEDYRDKHGSGSGLNLTPILQNHIKVGMPLEEVVQYFGEMNFVVHQSWKDKSTYVADHRSTVGLSAFNIVKNYRVLMNFSEKN